MKLFRSKRVVIALVAVLLLALFLVRPGANRLHTQVVESISLAVGRPVSVSSVHLQLLPQPGFELENFVVQDDPAFSAEPILRAQEVTAALRVRSLLSGRVEIARLVLTEPSFNLVRNADGHWNLESLLDRVARIPVAPTSKAGAESRPGFPYIESDLGRINLKLGTEKTPYALTDADFGLWQDSDNTWGMRLKARPIRTDFNQSDTGVVRLSGIWQRAASLRETPVQFTVQWEKAQLGQVTKLINGSDEGWRGTLDLSAAVSGTPSDLSVQTEGTVQDFHRYDILSSTQLRLASKCDAHYSTLDHTLKIGCKSPVGGGKVLVTGEIQSPTGERTYELQIKTVDLPAQSFVGLAGHWKQGLPEDLIARGKVNGELSVHGGGAGIWDAAWQGKGEAAQVRLESPSAGVEVVLGNIPFEVVQDVAGRAIGRSRRPGTSSASEAGPENRLQIGPFSAGLGRSTPATIRGWVSRSGYDFSVLGDAGIERLFAELRTLALPVWPLSARGTARLDLGVSGEWGRPGYADVRGKAQLRTVTADVRGINAPVEVESATLIFQPHGIDVQNLQSSVGNVSWRGSLMIPRHCETAGMCPTVADIQVGTVSLAQLNQVFNPYLRNQPWYGLFSSSSPSAYPLMRTYVIGKISADHFDVGRISASHVAARLELRNGQLLLSNLRGDVLGGKHVGEWRSNFASKPPQFSGNGKLDAVVLNQLAASMNDAWVTGAARATYSLSLSGASTAELLASASGTALVEARDSQLAHVSLSEDGGPLQVKRLTAHLRLHDGAFEIQDGKLDTTTGTYQVSGVASLDRALHLKLSHEGVPAFFITGPLSEPHVAQITTPETQAVLKP